VAHSWSYFRDVVLTLVRRDFTARYRNTVVGVAWSLITPLLFVVVFYFLFKVILNISIEKYASFVYIGVLVWTWFQSSVADGVAAITSNPNLVSQPGFPVASLPIVAVTTNLFNLVVALPVLLVLLFVEGTRPSLAMFWLPLIMIIQYAMTLSVCFFVAAVNVAIRDVQYIVPVILQIGYYLTPIFYSGDKIPERFRPIMRANPMYGLVGAYRDALIDGRSPDLVVLTATLAVSLILLAVAASYFRRASYRFLEDL
jgi:ABC-type polysaccharide/polyol phosphate export permease